MKLLLLNGHGIHIRVDKSKLYVKDGRFNITDEPLEYVFSPKRIDVDNVIIYGRNGSLTLDSIRWLIKHNVQITMLDWNGKLLTVMLPPESVQVKTKFAQYTAYIDNNLRIELAKKFISAKIQRTQIVLDWLKQKYTVINTDFQKELVLFKKANNIPEIMMVEGRIAGFYWQQLKTIFPNKYEFQTREYQKKPWGAGDHINCILNYGYAILESLCLKAINSAGLDCHVGFMHQMSMGKNSLAYDLQEPFRFLIDISIINLLENNSLTQKDFIRTENYNLRLRPTGAQKLVTEINKQFNQKTQFQGFEYSWHYILQNKTRDLAHYLLGNKKQVDFTEPKPILERQDTQEIRQKILKMNYTEWNKKGHSKGTLHYLKHNAQNNKPFKIYPTTQKLLMNSR